MRELEEHLGLTPAARIRLGIRLVDGPTPLERLRDSLNGRQQYDEDARPTYRIIDTDELPGPD